MSDCDETCQRIQFADPGGKSALRAAIRNIRWIVPPECQGKIIEVAYGDDRTGTLYRRCYDQSDRTTSYATADAADCGCADECDCYSPQNREPTGYEWTPYECPSLDKG